MADDDERLREGVRRCGGALKVRQFAPRAVVRAAWRVLREEGCEATSLEVERPLRDEEVVLVAEAVRGNASLESASFFAHPPDRAHGLRELGEALVRHGGIKSLMVWKNSVLASAVFESMLPSSSVTSLDVRACPGVGDAGSVWIARALKENQTLTSLTAGRCGLTSLVAPLLEHNRTLTLLDLSHNDKLGDRGAVIIADALARCDCPVRELRLRRCNIGPEGAAALCEALLCNSSLVSLVLSGNWIGDVGAAAIAIALRSNRTLRHLALRSAPWTRMARASSARRWR